MKKITQIEISNYRAFFNGKERSLSSAYRIQLPKGENLMVYGENGSGKSSLYHALNDFFESSAASSWEINENIFTEGELDLPESKIEILFSQWSQGVWSALETLELSKYAPTTHQNSLLQTANQAFLSYRDMLKTYFLAIDDKTAHPNLFELLVGRLLRNITEPTKNQQIQRNLRKIIKDVHDFEAIIQAIMAKNASKTGLKKARTEQEVRSDQKDILETAIFEFNKGLNALLNDLLELVNEYLTKYFKVNLQISLPESSDCLLLKENSEKLYIHQQLFFEMSYFGKKLKGVSYQTFLNEARLSALSLCLYLAAIKKESFIADNYKILFLDDIFIGLDMSNRLPLLELLNDNFKEYQIFMTTYDRMWFEVAKNHLKGSWKAIEMFTHTHEQIIEASGEKQFLEIPLLIDPSLDYLEKARLYFKKKDYPTSANFQRKWCEQFLKSYLQTNYRLEIAGNETALSITKLDVLFQKLQKFYEDCGKNLPDAIKKEFSKHKETVLNPFSHDDLASPVYRAELERGFELIEAFKKLEPLSKKTIAHAGDWMRMEISSQNYQLECVLKSDLMLIQQGTNKDYLKFKVDVKRYKQDNSEWAYPKPPISNTIQEISKMVFTKFLKMELPPHFDANTIFKLANGKSLAELKAG